MAEDDEDEDEDEDEDVEDGDGEDGDDEDGESSGGGKSKLILFIVIGVVFLLIAGAATAYFLGAFDSLLGGSDDAAMQGSAGGASGAGSGGGGGGGKSVNVRTVGHKYELPELALQLKPEGRQPHAALVRITLMLGRAEEEDIIHMDQSAAKFTESVQQAVAEFSYADFQGSSGPYLLREVLLQRLPPLAKPVVIRDILITNMIV